MSINYKKYPVKKSPEDLRDFKTKLSPHSSVVIPKKVSLRSLCPEIFDQLELGACTANSIAFLYAMYLGLKTVVFSRLFIYYFERLAEGTVKEDTGAYPIDGFKTVHSKGVCEERFWKYIISKFMECPPAQAIANALKYPKPTYIRLKSLGEIKQHIALTQQPVGFGMDVFSSFEDSFTIKSGIISMPKNTEENLGGHYMAFIGYDDSKVVTDGYGNKYTGCLEYRNSWGKNFGEQGYGWMPYAYLNKYTWDYLCFQ